MKTLALCLTLIAFSLAAVCFQLRADDSAKSAASCTSASSALPASAVPSGAAAAPPAVATDPNFLADWPASVIVKTVQDKAVALELTDDQKKAIQDLSAKAPVTSDDAVIRVEIQKVLSKGQLTRLSGMVHKLPKSAPSSAASAQSAAAPKPQ